MNDELLKISGRLSQKEQELRQAELRIRGMVKSIRNCLDPFADIEDLQADDAAQQALELANAKIQWIEISGTMRALKKALGR